MLVVSHDKEFVGRASNSIAEVAGGRLELYKSTTHDKFLVEREERPRGPGGLDALEAELFFIINADREAVVSPLFDRRDFTVRRPRLGQRRDALGRGGRCEVKPR